MAPVKLAKEIQDKFNINHIYARNIIYSLSNMKNISIEKIGAFIDEKPKPFVKWVGGKRQLLEQFKLMKYENYKKLFNENNVYVETNIHRVERDYEEIYKAYMKQEIVEFVQCVTYFEDKPQVVVSFDIFNRSRKWSDNDIDFLTILGKLIGDVVLKNILNK